MEYTAKHIDILNPVQHIRENPGMYIGDTNNPKKLIDEIIDNALDEITSGNADLINLIIKKDGTITVIDNGRGIPLDLHPKVKKYVPELIVTELFSSGKFKSNKEKQYKCSIGLHGVGSTVVNALSDFMTILVKRKKEFGKFHFEKFETKTAEVIKKKNDVTGTFITFKPSKEYFDELYDFNLDSIILKLKFASVVNPNLKALIKVEGKEDIPIINVNLDTILDYSFKGKIQNPIFENYMLFKVKDKKTTESLLVAFNYDEIKTNKSYVGCVNLTNVNEGTHINLVRNLILEELDKLLTSEQRKILKQDDLLIGIRCFVLTFLDDSRFGGQVKDKLTTKDKAFDNMISLLRNEIKKYFKDNDKLIKEKIIGKAIKHRNSLDGKKTKKKSKRQSLKLVDCDNTPDNILFIVEGDSAAGSAQKARIPEKHAIFPLKGKILNVETASMNKIIKNQEVMDLINAIGAIEFNKGEFVDTNFCRYSKIVIMADGDVDGKHITSICCKLFKSLMPRLIDEDRIFIADMPLYGLDKKTHIIPIYDLNEAQKLMNKKVHLNRYKGLGEMDPQKELKEVMYGKHKRWIQLSHDNT